MVAGVAVAVVVPSMLFTICTEQRTVPPPPLPEPLHWLTLVTRLADGSVDVVQVGVVFAAP